VLRSKGLSSSLRGGNALSAGSGLFKQNSSRTALSLAGGSPSLRNATNLSSGSFYADQIKSSNNYNYYGGYPGYYPGCYPGYSGYYPYWGGGCWNGFSVSVGFGYPYCGWGLGWGWSGGWGVGVSFGFGYPYYGYGYGYPYYGYGYGYGNGYGYPYWRYPYYGYPYHSVYVAYPYIGYYYSYPYPYLASYDDYYDCSFYDTYSVRFGACRASYYEECSGYGCHDYSCHHCHLCDCAEHGHHYYHVRDCPLCYPGGGDSYVYHDVDVPDVAAPAPERAQGSLPAVERTGPPAGSATAVASEAKAQVETLPVEREEAFYSSLRPAQLSFALGLVHWQHGEYDNAVESFYSSSIEDPSSRLCKLFLGTSLFTVGEYPFAAEYLRLALQDWEAFPSYEWNIVRLYPNPKDFQEQVALLDGEVRLNPSNNDALLTLGVLRFHSGDVPGAARAFEALRSLSRDPLDQDITARYVREIERREGVTPAAGAADVALAMNAEDEAVQTFLDSMMLRDVPALPIR